MRQILVNSVTEKSACSFNGLQLRFVLSQDGALRWLLLVLTQTEFIQSIASVEITLLPVLAMARLLNFLSAALMKKTRNTGKSFIESLPAELLTEILAQVASASVSDLSNAKLSCREFFRAGNDDYVFEHASLDKFPIAWPVNDKAAYLFLKRCKKSGNPESLYRQGMFEYFSLCSTNSGLQLLKKAAGKKHAEAKYVYSIILLCSGDQFKQQGFELLSSLTSSRIRECRKNIKRVIGSMWIRNIVVQEEDFNSTACNCLSPRNRGWRDEDEIVGCRRESCLCVGEVNFFCNLLRNSYVFKFNDV